MKRLHQLLRLIPALAALHLAAPAFAGDANRVPTPDIPKAKGEQCVEPTSEMRRNHMKYLLTHRDETMHEGIRTKKYSLKECLECHAAPENEQAAGQDEGKFFCATCHAYAGVKIDCFECHATKPETTAQFHPLVTPNMQDWRAAHTPASSVLREQMAQKNSDTGAAQ